MIYMVNYQIIVDSVAAMLLIGFPIILILDIAKKLVNTFLGFITGKRVDF